MSLRCVPVFRVTPFSIGEMIVKTKRCKIGVLLLLLLLPGCSRQPVEAQVYAMDTLMTIKLWGSHGETAIQDLSRLFQEQESQLSVTRTVSPYFSPKRAVAPSGPLWKSCPMQIF